MTGKTEAMESYFIEEDYLDCEGICIFKRIDIDAVEFICSCSTKETAVTIHQALSHRVDVDIESFSYDDAKVWQLQEDKRAFMITTPKGLNPNTQSLVAIFAHKLAVKLFRAEQKYGYSDGWKNPDWMDECRKKLREHVDKGDPVDVAAYCAFLDHHQESTAK